MTDKDDNGGNAGLIRALSRFDSPLRTLEAGHVWLAGAGPGDPGLLTLDVLSALAQADALVHDALVSPEIIAVAEQAEKFYVGKRGGRLSIPQADINALLVRLASEGRKVVRLKGGHPYVFGRGGEEALALVENNIPYRVLPGVTSAFGGLTSAGIPATMRGVNGAIILATGFAAVSDDRPDWTALARTGQPIIIYMGLTHMAATVADLRAGGLGEDTPAALIENATLPTERTVVATLGTLVDAAAREHITSPALIVVGGIVAMRKQLAGRA
ncbi:MAG TPA: uroporphyrinogen-III C-methyltransferase [Mesorhizobium sp.]